MTSHTQFFLQNTDSLGYSGMKSGFGKPGKPMGLVVKSQMFHLQPHGFLVTTMARSGTIPGGMDMLNTITVLNKLSRLKGASIL